MKDMNRFKELTEIMNSMEKDFNAFYEKNNKAAGTRVRKAMMDLKVLAQDLRKDVLTVKEVKDKK